VSDNARSAARRWTSVGQTAYMTNFGTPSPLARRGWRTIFSRSSGNRSFQAMMPSRPILLTAEVEPYGLSISLLDDERFELSVTDWEQECSPEYVFDDIDSAQRSALMLTGAGSIEWRDLRTAETE
jgi:hypothetical protein